MWQQLRRIQEIHRIISWLLEGQSGKQKIQGVHDCRIFQAIVQRTFLFFFEFPRNVFEFPRNVLEIPRHVLEIPRYFLDIRRHFLEIPRNFLDILWSFVECPRKFLEIPRIVLEISRTIHVFSDKPEGNKSGKSLKMIWKLTTDP